MPAHRAADSGKEGEQVLAVAHDVEEREVGAAFLWYRKAALSGDLRALTRQGIILHESQTYQTEGLKYILDAENRFLH